MKPISVVLRDNNGRDGTDMAGLEGREAPLDNTDLLKAIEVLKPFEGLSLEQWRKRNVVVSSGYTARVTSDDDKVSRDYAAFCFDDHDAPTRLKTSNCMGVLQLRHGDDAVQLEIRSRFDTGKRQFFLNHLLSTVFGGCFLTDIQAGKDSMWDMLLAFAFRRRLLDACRVGLFKQYRKFEHNDLRFRGKFNIDEHFRRNVPIGASVSYTTHEISFDNGLNHLVRHAMTKVIRQWPAILGENRDITSLRHELEQNTPTWHHGSAVDCIRRNLLPVRHPYFHSYYEPLRQLSLSILRDEGASLYSEAHDVEGILFDGAWLWEEYLWTLLKPLGFQHAQNKEHIGGWEPLAGITYYPDFYHPGRPLVLDAKYTQAGHEKEHVRQVLAYMYVGNANDGGIITPNQSRYPVPTALERIGGAPGRWYDLALCVPHAEDAKTFRERIATAERLLVKNLRSYCQATGTPEPLVPPVHLTQGSDLASIERN